MPHALAFFLTFFLIQPDSGKIASTASSRGETAQSCPLIHIEIINMSGKSREAHLGNTVIPLPIAQRVALQMLAGKSVKIMSNTNTKIMQVMVISALDEGRLFPVI